MPTAMSKPVLFFAEDWNKTLDRHRLMIIPTYLMDNLTEVRINLNTPRYLTDMRQWYDLVIDGKKNLPMFANLQDNPTDFSHGMITIHVNSAVSGYKEDDISDWLRWITIEYLHAIGIK